MPATDAPMAEQQCTASQSDDYGYHGEDADEYQDGAFVHRPG